MKTVVGTSWREAPSNKCLVSTKKQRSEKSLSQIRLDCSLEHGEVNLGLDKCLPIPWPYNLRRASNFSSAAFCFSFSANSARELRHALH